MVDFFVKVWCGLFIIGILAKNSVFGDNWGLKKGNNRKRNRR